MQDDRARLLLPSMRVVFGRPWLIFSRKSRHKTRRCRALCPSPRRRSSCNLAIGLRRQGIPTALVTQVGSDAFGRFIKQKLDSEGVAVDGIASPQERTHRVTFVSVAATGERSFLFYRHPSADMLVTTAEVTPPLILRGRLFHFGSSSLSREPARAATCMHWSLSTSSANSAS